MLLDRRDIDDGCTVGQESRGQDCWPERESKTAGWERGGRLGGRGLCCCAGERLTTVGLLGGRGQDY